MSQLFPFLKFLYLPRIFSLLLRLLLYFCFFSLLPSSPQNHIVHIAATETKLYVYTELAQFVSLTEL